MTSNLGLRCSDQDVQTNVGDRLEEMAHRLFAFENWHSALEMKLYIRRYIHHIGGLPDFSALRFTRYNQYESMILPMIKYLEGRRRRTHPVRARKEICPMFGHNSKVDLELNREVEKLIKTGGKEKIMPIVQAGEPVLRQQTIAYDGQLSRKTRDKLIDTMRTTMLEAPGVERRRFRRLRRRRWRARMRSRTPSSTPARSAPAAKDTILRPYASLTSARWNTARIRAIHFSAERIGQAEIRA